MSEYYVMPSFAKLAVRDLITATRWYQEALGFNSVFEMPGASGAIVLVHLRRARYQDLLLVAAPPDFLLSGELGRGVTINFTIEEGVDELATRAKTAGAQLIEGPIDRPWNVRELTLSDLDGYRLTFSEQINHRSFSEVLQAIKRDY